MERAGAGGLVSNSQRGCKMPLIIAGFQRITQRTVKFIRWLRCFLWQTHPLDVLLLILKKRYATL